MHPPWINHCDQEKGHLEWPMAIQTNSSLRSEVKWKWKSFSCVWNSPGQSTGVGSLSLFQGVFPTQGSNPGLPHCRWILYQLSHKGSPRILEWVVYPFSKGFSQPRNWTGISCIVGRFFTNWAIREALYYPFFKNVFLIIDRLINLELKLSSDSELWLSL